jgi:hypothetical protein
MAIKSPANVVMIYAQGGMGKSTLGAQAAAYVHKKFGMKTRVVNADGGGTVNAHAPLIEMGVVSMWNIDLWDEKSTFYNIEQASKGYWPEDVTEPNSPLLPPFESYKECPLCKDNVGAKGFNLPPKCASCGKILPAGTFCKGKTVILPSFEGVGAVIFEGFTSFGEVLMRRLQKANPEGGRSIVDEGFKITAPGQQHYGDAQAYLGKYVAHSKNIPVELVMWTALENRGDDDGKPVYGPKGPGQALTAACIPWFTDVIHLDGIPKVDKAGRIEKDENGLEMVDRKLFLANHFPPDNKMYQFRAKTSSTLEGNMPTVMDFPAKGNTFARFMDELTAAKQRAKAVLLG